MWREARGNRDAGDVKGPNVEELREAWDALAVDSASVATKLLELAENAESEIVRVRVARAVLDRVGVRPGVDVGLSATSLVDIQPTPAARRAVDIVVERLAALRSDQEQAWSHVGQLP